MIPRAPGSWLTGQLADRQRLGADFYGEMARRHGDVCALQLGRWRFVLLSHPDLVGEVLRERPDGFSKGDSFGTLKSVLGDGLFFSEGATWRRQRRVVQPAFHRANLADAVRQMARCVEDALPTFDAAARSGQALDLHAEMTRLTLDMAGRTLFGATLAGPDRDRLGRRVDELSRAIGERLFSVVQQLPLWAPFEVNRRIRAAVRELDALVARLIDARAAEPHGGARDILGDLLAARDEQTGAALSRQELRDQVMTFFLAGHETSASALTWSTKLLVDHPHVADDLRAEVDARPAGEGATLERLGALPVTTAGFREAIRLYPPGWTFTRQALTDQTVGGTPIPGGTHLLICPYAMHRDPRFWTDPLTFDPGRFPLPTGSRAAYLPFGSGPRACIGGQFATLQATLVLAELFGRYEFTALPGPPVRVEPLVTLRPAGGVPVRVAFRRPTPTGDRP